MSLESICEELGRPDRLTIPVGPNHDYVMPAAEAGGDRCQPTGGSCRTRLGTLSLGIERSRRTLVVPATIIQRLRDHETRQLAEKLWAGSTWIESGFVFTNRTGGPLPARRVIEEFHKALKSAGLQRIRFHDLRHSCATLLLVQEVPDRVVMQILGHSDISMTLEYIHVIPELQRNAAERMESLISLDRPHQLERDR